MEVISNSELTKLTTSAIDCVWFSKYSMSESSMKDSLTTFIEKVIRGYFNEASDDVFLKYYIDWTAIDKYPKFPGLMEYNKIPQLDTPRDYSRANILAFNNERHYIGEYYISDSIITSKIIFPKELINAGYNTAIVFQDEPNMQEITENTTNISWKYIIILDEKGIDRVTNNIIQFSNDSSNAEEVFTHIHESNYSNPHVDQISRISTTSETSRITSFQEFNNLVTNTNSIVIKNYLVAEDYSVIYLGDQLDIGDSSEFNNLWGR